MIEQPLAQGPFAASLVVALALCVLVRRPESGAAIAALGLSRRRERSDKQRTLGHCRVGDELEELVRFRPQRFGRGPERVGLQPLEDGQRAYVRSLGIEERTG